VLQATAVHSDTDIDWYIAQSIEALEDRLKSKAEFSQADMQSRCKQYEQKLELQKEAKVCDRLGGEPMRKGTHVCQHWH
jgi:hypothetical protein